MDSGTLRELAKKIGDGKATDKEKVAFLEAMYQEMAELRSMVLQEKDRK